MPLTNCNLVQSNNHSKSRVQRRSIWAALCLTALFMVVEFVGGILTNSLALMADAGHMLTDVAALGLSTFALWFSARPATESKTYGFYRVEILAALVNGITLGVLSLIIFYESCLRLSHPPEVKSGAMLLIAVLGLVVNLASAYFLHEVQHANLNLKGAFLHVVGDAISSLGAIVAGMLMYLWKWYWADPLASTLVGVLILYNAWGLVRDAVDILLEGAPAHVNLEAVRQELSKVSGVESIHDLHVWTLTSGIHALTCHAQVVANADKHRVLEALKLLVWQQFKIDHSTIQLEESCFTSCAELGKAESQPHSPACSRSHCRI